MVRYDENGLPYDDEEQEGAPPPNQPGTNPPAPAGNTADQQAVIDYYNKYLGRAPEAGDVDKWLSGAYGWGGTGNLAGIEQGISGSQEAFQRNPTAADDRTDKWSGRYDVAPDPMHYENLAGFDFKNLADPHMQTLKYQFARLAQQYAPNPEGLKALVASPKFKAQFPNAKLVGEDGIDFGYGDGKVDVGQGFGAANSKWWWGPQGASAGAASGGGGGGGGAKAGTPLFDGGGGGGGGGGAPGAMDFPMLDVPTFVNDLGDYVPGTYTPTEWNAPKPEDVYSDPSYQFRFGEGLKPVTNSLALGGLMKSGATMKALQRYGQNFASDEFGRIYDRAADTYDRTELNRKGAFTTNEANRKSAYETNYGTRKDAYGYAVDEATKEYAPRQKWAELQYGRDWDVYKYTNDDAYRRWRDSLNAATTGSQFGTNNP